MLRSKHPLTVSVVAFLAGLVAAPYVKPLMRFALTKSVRAALKAKQIAAEATEDIQDIVAEASAPSTGSVSDATSSKKP